MEEILALMPTEVVLCRYELVAPVHPTLDYPSLLVSAYAPFRMGLDHAEAQTSPSGAKSHSPLHNWY